ncbi:ComEC/Rec2 family competence protein, partial [bacterium]|nr:ComEC/Rec2 family competence protein [bacterium]
SKFVKKSFLTVIKKTVPYPESAFLGGVELGLREGLSQTIQAQFRAAGVSHVLAVSGLHVTIITVMLVILCTIFKVPRKYYVPLIVFFLLIFTIITGMRPSTQRAALMNSLGLISLMLADLFAGKEMPFSYSLTFGVSVATILLLIMNPLLIFEPGFTLSFGAIISLAVITNPLDEFLSKYLSGKNFLIVFPLFVSGYFLLAQFFSAVLANYWPLLFPILLSLVYFTRERKFNFFSYGFKDLNPFVASFISAQGAILFGMMFPLSSYYFYQVSLSSPFANFIAIPLIGIIVQLGILAGIIAFIPFIGIYIALALNAANYLLIKLFLFIAYAFSLMPFPYSPRLPGKLYILYAIMIFTFCFWLPVKRFFSGIVLKFKLNYGNFRKKFAIATISMFLVLISTIIWARFFKVEPLYNVTFISDKVSQCAIINFPELSKKPIFINAGDKALVFKKFSTEDIEYDSGERTSSKVMLGSGKSSIEAIIFTSMKKENCGGAKFLMINFAVEKIYVPEKFRNFIGTTFEQFLAEYYEKDLLWNEQELILTYKYIKEVLHTATDKNIDIVYVDEEMKVNLNGIDVTLVPFTADENSRNIITDSSVMVSLGAKGQKMIFTGDSKKIPHEWVEKDSFLVLGRNGDLAIDKKDLEGFEKNNINRVMIQSGFKNRDFVKDIESVILTLEEKKIHVYETLSGGGAVTRDYFKKKGFVVR